MKVPYVKAVNDALKEEMRRDGKIIVYGEDVAEFGGIFGETRGLLEEFSPKRVRNTPIVETAIVASAVGAAITGLRPCVELMYAEFTMAAFTEIFHLVSKWRYIHGPEYSNPVCLRLFQRRGSRTLQRGGEPVSARLGPDPDYPLVRL